MSYNAIVFNVMIASPGDVASERSIIREVIYEWNVVHSKDRNIVLLPIGWESHSSPEIMHYIKNVKIKKNGILISINKYGAQPTGSIFTYNYKIPAAKGDVFEVTATCNFWGHKTSTLTVP